MTPVVTAVSLSPTHSFRKLPQDRITLLTGLGIEGDAHCGTTTQHRYLMKKDPTRPNLCQVHLIAAELHQQLNAAGFHLAPGAMGENITTRGIDLLALPTDTLIYIGETTVLAVTGLRDPCAQLNRCAPGLMNAVLERHPDGSLIRKAGIMAVVRQGGIVRTGDALRIELPPPHYQPLQPV